MGYEYGVDLRNFMKYDPVDDLKDFLTRLYDIKLYDSPPRSTLHFIKLYKNHPNATLFDIDVGYMREMQAECYTPGEGYEQSDLGAMSLLLKLIDEVRPRAITISEPTVATINDLESKFNSFLNKIKTFGYEISYSDGNFRSDEEARTAIEFWDDYFTRVVKPSLSEDKMFQDAVKEARRWEASRRHRSV